MSDVDPAELRAKVFEDREIPGQWRVEWFDDDGGCEVDVFTGFDARWQAIRCAADKYGVFEVIWLGPYRDGSGSGSQKETAVNNGPQVM